MAIQYYSVTGTGKKYALDKSTGKATEVSSIPSGSATITWSGSGLPPDLSNAGVTAPSVGNISNSMGGFAPSQTPATQSGENYQVNYDPNNLNSMKTALNGLLNNLKTPADDAAYQTLLNKINVEQSRQDSIIQKAKSLVSGGSGSTAINNFYSSLSPSDQQLVGSTLGPNVIKGYVPTNSSVQQTTVTPNGVTTNQTGAQFPTTTLQTGATGDSVKKLQDWLVSNGYMTQAQVNTGYGTYGPQTTAAVNQLQKDLGVDNSTGPGDFGPRTIAAIQSFISKTPSSGGSNQSQASATQNGPISAGSTGNDNLDKILQSVAGVANNIITSGYTIPDTLKITPDIVSKFLGWAHQVVDPQTQQLIAGEAANINASLKNTASQYTANQGNIVQQFGTDLATEQNASGGSGTAFSGQRALNEGNLANSTNRSLASLDASTALSAGNTLRSGAANVGSANTGMFSVPYLNSGSVSASGGQRGSFSAGNSLDFGYNPSLYTAGNIPTQQNTALNNLQSNYLNQYGTLAANNSNGSRSVKDLFGLMSGLPSGALL